MLFFLLSLVTLFSYFSIYRPDLISTNITALTKPATKHGLFILLVSGSSFWVFYSDVSEQNMISKILIELLLIQIAVIDGYSKIIPNRLIVVLLTVVLLGLIQIESQVNWVAVILICSGITGVQLLYRSVTKKNLFGWGDIKLLLVLTLFFQLEMLIVIWVAIISAGIFSLVLLLINSANRSRQIPLSPFIVAIIFLLTENDVWGVNLLLNTL